MKLVAFSLDEDLLITNQAELSDTIRLFLYNTSPELLELLDYDDDNTFLEPALFYYFLADAAPKNSAPLPQTLYGYLPAAHRLAVLPVKADATGLIYLPGTGYFQVSPQAELLLHWEAAAETLHLTTMAGEPVTAPLLPERWLPNSSIRLALHNTDLLDTYLTAQLAEPVAISTERNYPSLRQAVDLLNQHLPAFARLLSLAIRELVLFNSPTQLSLATISYHGTAFLNVGATENTAVYFLDDLAHQCGHVIFNALTLQTEDFLLVSKHSPLNQFTHESGDKRSVYSVFHAFFTYTTILYCLDHCLQHNLLAAGEQREALARLGFYVSKFRADVAEFPADQVLTAAGRQYHDMFRASQQAIEDRYQRQLEPLSYRNQQYVFDYSRFLAANDELFVQ
jgi:HEXXH motif-containing protein